MPDDSRQLTIAQERDHTLKTIKIHMEDQRDIIQASLGRAVPYERFQRVVINAMNKSPELLDAEPRSLFNSCMAAATDGLLPDGREGAIVLYNMKVKGANGQDQWIKAAQWMPMIEGLRKKARNSGEIKTWEVHLIYEKDHFDYQLGDEPFIVHKPEMLRERGEIIGAYSIAKLRNGEISREIMSREEIEQVRRSSKSPDKGPWGSHYGEMARKTVARRHYKSLPHSVDMDMTVRHSDEADGYTEAARPAIQAASADTIKRLENLGSRSDLGGGETIDADTGEILDSNADRQEPERNQSGNQGFNLIAIWQEGMVAKANGQSKKDMPATYLEDNADEAMAAWLAGFAGKPSPE